MVRGWFEKNWFGWLNRGDCGLRSFTSFPVYPIELIWFREPGTY